MTDPRPVYTAHDLVDLFNTLPVLLGFRPEESLVAVATAGPRRRMGFRMRVDMPPDLDAVDLVASHVVAHLRHQRAEGVIVLAVTERQDVARGLTRAIERMLGAIEPVVVARSDGRRYWVDVPGFPACGLPLELSDHHVAVVSAIAAGQEILPDRQALVDRWRAVSGERRRVMTRACAPVQHHVVGVLEHHPSDAGDRGVAELAPVLDSIERGRALTDAEVALLCVWVGLSQVRDHVWERITPSTASAYLPALCHAAASAVPPHEPAVLCLGGFAAWLTGDGTQAVIAGERAQAVDPQYPMAELLLQLVGGGVSPTSWHDVA